MAGDPSAALAELVPVPRLDLRIRNTGERVLLGWRDTVMELEGVAVFMWHQVDGERTVGAIAALMAREYEVDEQMVLADIAETLTTLQDANLIRLTAAAETGRSWY